MHRQRIPTLAQVEPETYPLGENTELPYFQYALALVALTHTPLEHRIYSTMLNMQHHESAKASFTVRSLASLTGIQSLSTVRRALDRLLLKLSVERTAKQNGNRKPDQSSVYRAYTPNEVL